MSSWNQGKNLNNIQTEIRKLKEIGGTILNIDNINSWTLNNGCSLDANGNYNFTGDDGQGLQGNILSNQSFSGPTITYAELVMDITTESDSLSLGICTLPLINQTSNGGVPSLIKYGIYLYPGPGYISSITNGIISNIQIPYSFTNTTKIQMINSGTSLYFLINGILRNEFTQTINDSTYYSLLGGGYLGQIKEGICYIPNGIQGTQGEQGQQGIQGTIGPIGPIGIQGIQGNVGSQGPQGTKGDTGLQGIQGIQGNIGLQGTQGPIGNVTSGDSNLSVDNADINGNLEAVGNVTLGNVTMITPNVFVQALSNGTVRNGIVYDSFFNLPNTIIPVNINLNPPPSTFPYINEQVLINLFTWSNLVNTYNLFVLNISQFTVNYQVTTNQPLPSTFDLQFALTCDLDSSTTLSNTLTIVNSSPNYSTNTYTLQSPFQLQLYLTVDQTDTIYFTTYTTLGIPGNAYLRVNSISLIGQITASNGFVDTTPVTINVRPT